MTLLTPELLDTKTYGFEKLRYLLQSLDVQEGVVDSGDLKIVQRAAGGAAMFVDAPAGRCFVQADTGTRNGLYHVVNDGTVTTAIPASNATLPRVDQFVIEVRDTSDLGSAADDAIFRVIAGAPTSGATLDNAYTTGGAAALPANCIRLADVLVPAASTSVTNANIRDRRKWARGAYTKIIRTSNAGGTNDYALVPGAGVAGIIDATNLAPRIELSGVPARVSLRGRGTPGSDGSVGVQYRDNGNPIDALAVGRAHHISFSTGGNYNAGLSGSWDFVPTPGTRLLAPYVISPITTTITVEARADSPLIFIIEEILRSNANNS